MDQGGQKLGELGPYTLIEQIAVGGMAEIYMAKTRGVAGFEKYLCLKVIHPNYADDEHFIQMLIDEAKIAVGLNHANIVQIFDLGRDDRTYFIAMEYIDGADLFKVMRRLSEHDIDVPIDVAAYIAHEVCTGLDYAHRKRDEQGRPLGIIHRDISPQNILISYSGEVKIVDFGIAKAASRGRKTQAGVIKGKYYYMSPEQAWGDPVDQRSDIFSAGIILYEVLVGQMLYLEEDMHRLLDMVRKADIERPTTKRPDIPPQLENVVMKALAKRPSDRWQTAHEFQVALTNFLFSTAPDFTPSRLAEVLRAAMSDEEVVAPPPEPTPIRQPDRPQPHQPRGPTRQVNVDSLMSRVDYKPKTEHSVIFRVGDMLAPQTTDEEDRGEKTQITGPPTMMQGLYPELEKTAVDWDGGQGRRDNDPTTVSVNPPLRAQDDARPRRRSRQLPAEVVVPRAQMTTDPDLTPPPLQSDLTPTPVMDPPPPNPANPPNQPAQPPPIPPSAAKSSWPSLPPNLGKTGQTEPDPPPSWSPPAPSPEPHWSQPPPQPQPRQSPPAPPVPPPTPPMPPLPVGPPKWSAQGQSEPWSGPVQPAPSPSGWPATPAWTPPGAPSAWPPQPVPVPQQGQLPPNPAAAPSWPTPQPQPPPAWPTPPGGAPPQLQATAQPSPWPGGPGAQQVTLPTDEVSGRASRRRHRRLVLAGLVSVLGLAVVAAVFLVVLYPMTEEGGTVEVISVPDGARVTFAGRQIAKRTPVVIPVTDLKRTYQVEVSLPNFQPWRRKLTLSADDSRIRVLAVLTPIYGRLSVRSVPKGADIYVNGEHRGKTPATIENLLPTENVRLELRKRGYRPATQHLQWGNQTYLTADITLRASR